MEERTVGTEAAKAGGKMRGAKGGRRHPTGELLGLQDGSIRSEKVAQQEIGTKSPGEPTTGKHKTSPTTHGEPGRETGTAKNARAGSC